MYMEGRRRGGEGSGRGEGQEEEQEGECQVTEYNYLITWASILIIQNIYYVILTIESHNYILQLNH